MGYMDTNVQILVENVNAIQAVTTPTDIAQMVVNQGIEETNAVKVRVVIYTTCIL